MQATIIVATLMIAGLDVAAVAASPWVKPVALRQPACPMRLRGGEGPTKSQVAAYMLCRMGGNDSPTLDDVKACLESVGAKVGIRAV